MSIQATIKNILSHYGREVKICNGGQEILVKAVITPVLSKSRQIYDARYADTGEQLPTSYSYTGPADERGRAICGDSIIRDATGSYIVAGWEYFFWQEEKAFIRADLKRIERREETL